MVDLPFVFHGKRGALNPFLGKKGVYCSGNTNHQGPGAYISDEGYKFSNQYLANTFSRICMSSRNIRSRLLSWKKIKDHCVYAGKINETNNAE